MSPLILASALPRSPPVIELFLCSFRISDQQNDKPIKDGGNEHGESLKEVELFSNETEV